MENKYGDLVARFPLCPRAKRIIPHTGEFNFKSLQIFTVGEADNFVRALRVFCPELPIKSVPRDKANLVLSVASAFSNEKEYSSLRILDKYMEIRCCDNGGVRNAAAIIAQLICQTELGWSLPCGWIEDWPDASYRAMLLESSGRAWISMERIYFYIREMALARMNVLLFHFIEGPGCTIQLDCYPDWHGYGKENLKYTKDEIRAMISYADELGITVTPFVEVLSHSITFNKVADIACPNDKDENMFAVCVGQEKTFDAIEKVIAEVAELFPSPILHIGADEYDMSACTPKTAYWSKCPHCRSLSEKMGFTTLRELFLYSIEKINRIVNKFGKVAMMWNADLNPDEIPSGFPRNIIIHYYISYNNLGSEKIFNLWPNDYVEKGFTVLNSHTPNTYMDMPQYMNTEKLNNWGYLSNPQVAQKNKAAVIGGCCCAWEDYTHYERTIPPAIFLFADRLWNSNGDQISYDDSYGRLLTRNIFEKKLPPEINVFNAIGDVLPPLSNTEKFHRKRMVAELDELYRIHESLSKLVYSKNQPHLVGLAKVYADIVDETIDYCKNKGLSH